MDNLAKVFGMEEHQVTMETTQTVIPGGTEEDADFDAARGNMYQLLDQGKAAIETAMIVAAETQNPRSIEVLGNLIKTMADINKQLLSLSKDKADIKSTKNVRTPAQSTPIGNIQNAVFVGNGADLNKMLKQNVN